MPYHWKISPNASTYTAGRGRPSVRGKTAIIADDGIATGLTIRVAIHDIKEKRPERVVVAIPVTPTDTERLIQQELDEVVTLESIPSGYFGAVGAHYHEFKEVTDEDVLHILQNSIPL